MSTKYAEVGHVIPPTDEISPEQERAALRTICRHATDLTEALEFARMLGLRT